MPVALSKQEAAERTASTRMLLGKCSGQRHTFLSVVWRAEIFTDGYFPCIFPRVVGSAWGAVEEGTWLTMEKFGAALIKLGLFDLVTEQWPIDAEVDTSQFEVCSFHLRISMLLNPNLKLIVETITSDRCLDGLMFRSGVYQRIAGCPFDGLEAAYPAKAFRIYLAALHWASDPAERGQSMKAAMKLMFRTLVHILISASIVSSKTLPAQVDVDEELSRRTKRRRGAFPTTSSAGTSLINLL